MDNLDKWLGVITNPLGLVGFVLFLTFSILFFTVKIKAEYKNIFGIISIVSIIGVFVLAYYNIKQPERDKENLPNHDRYTDAEAVSAVAVSGKYYTKTDIDTNFASKTHNHDDLYSTSTKAYINALENRVKALEEKLVKVTVDTDNIYITGANLHIRSGSGATDAEKNGKGNLIVGYNEKDAGDDQSGSHNIVVGKNHTYSSFGGLVVGYNNNVTNRYSSVSGGTNNKATGEYSWVGGGMSNEAIKWASSVSGGDGNKASGVYSSVSGGKSNTALGDLSSISGGNGNSVSGKYASVGGGQGYTVNEDSVSGFGRVFASDYKKW